MKTNRTIGKHIRQEQERLDNDGKLRRKVRSAISSTDSLRFAVVSWNVRGRAIRPTSPMPLNYIKLCEEFSSLAPASATRIESSASDQQSAISNQKSAISIQQNLAKAH
jgi:hypothetical protein